MKPAAFLASCFLALVAVAHLLRLALSIPLVVGAVTIPMWPSLLAFVGPGALALWLWREQRPVGR